ncbi:hypothetical protein MCEJIRE27_00484 [Candidatus Nanopelagicaceae bacterium]
MGFARRAVSRSVRRAVGPSVWNAAHPVRTAKRALIPAPVRKARRMVYIATNPVGAAENAVINSVFRSFDEISRLSSKSLSGSFQQETTGYYVGEREAVGIESDNLIEQLMRVERERFQDVSRPLIADPPQVLSKPFYDLEMKRRRGEFKFYQLSMKRVISQESWVVAENQAKAQFELDLKYRDSEQAKADHWWKLLNDGDEKTLTEALKLAFSDNQAPVIVDSAIGGKATFYLLLPDINILPEKRMNITPTGRVSSKKWTTAEKNEVYGDLLGAHLIATLREAWAVAPSLQEIRIIGVDQESGSEDKALFDVTALREDGRWGDDNWGAVILEIAKYGLKYKGKSKEIVHWSQKEIPVRIS